MKKPIIFLLVILFQFMLLSPILSLGANTVSAKKVDSSSQEEIKITAKSGYLVDYNSGNVIYSKNEHERLPIASMTKLATLSLVFDAIGKGIIKENDMVTVSKTAADVGGSSAFLDAGSSYKVVDLIKTVIIASANDSAVALAEYVAGSENGFVARMNKFAESLNLADTNFENCTGLPAKNHYSTAYDMAKIYSTMCNNKLYKKFSKIWMEDFIHPSGRKTSLVNTNRLIKTYDGIEGGKTGYTDSARFCLTASASRNSMRLVGVIIGANDSKTRFAEMSQMFDYGFANYTNKVVVNSEVPVTVLSPKNSKQTAEVYPERNTIMFMTKGDDMTYTTDFQLTETKAPVKAGDSVGKLYVFDKNNMVVDEMNLIVKTDLSEIGFKDIFGKLVNEW